MLFRLLTLLLCCSSMAFGQDYFYKKYTPFNQEVSSPASFLGYDIGSQHTRHDLIVSYLEQLAATSNRAQIMPYGKTHEGRKLAFLVVSSPENLSRLPEIKEAHLASIKSGVALKGSALPLIINLAYNVHGNEPSSSEAALLAAYTFVASKNPDIEKYLENAVIFIDPTINPDGRDRHTQWANTYKGSPLVADPQDAEHNEYWPGGRTNHYWFDLNRDWLLTVNPESQGKVAWSHEWYPNVVTDFHEMGSQSTYFFEPMKPNASSKPIMPKENYTTLNDLFGGYFSKALDSIGSLYFTKEAFDGTYPGYGSSYPDLQGALALLFEQASSRGLKQTTAFGEITFPFTIRNQYVSSITTVKAAVENAATLQAYQRDFFKSAFTNAAAEKIKGYSFKETDKNLAKAFIGKLNTHKVSVYQTAIDEYVVPTSQAQYRMVQSFFETYNKYRDSVYYDASAWSVANFFNISYKPISKLPKLDQLIIAKDLVTARPFKAADYAYAIEARDYNIPAAIAHLQKNGVVLSAAFKPFKVATFDGAKSFSYGSLMVPVALQKISKDSLASLMADLPSKLGVSVSAVQSGLSLSGVDLGSRNVRPLMAPKAAMIIGNGTSSYEAGEIWHLLDTRVGIPISKLPIRNLDRVSLDAYNTLVMVSGRYSLSEKFSKALSDWASKGNTLITIGTGSSWAVNTKFVKEKLIKVVPDSTTLTSRKPYVDAGENIGREALGGVFLKGDMDLSHPLGFGYDQSRVALYKNNEVWLAPSKSAYGTVIDYAEKPHLDGYISEKNQREFLPKSASLIVSPKGMGRVIMFADNPNFRGIHYGMNRLFLNAIFLGNHIEVPSE
ncbi:M14 family metallopeptidase [Flavobacteriaceae bacterium]|nr:M14 family metallopeptidase [Flavobacteriaceae bacterium]